MEAPFPTVGEVMQSDPRTIEGMASVSEALAVMRAHNYTCLVVPRRDERDEYGLLQITDIAREVISKNRPLSRTNVYEVMTKPAPALDKDMSVKYAIRHMNRFGLTHCVVLSGRDLAGIVTLKTMTYCYLNALEEKKALEAKKKDLED